MQLPCASIHACECGGRHLVAYEKYFTYLMWTPLSDAEPTTPPGGHVSHDASIEYDEENVKKIARKTCLSK